MEYIEDFMLDAFKGHKLRLLFRNEHMVVFRMRNPERSHFWCDIMFTKIGTIIGGDLRITDRVAVIGGPSGLDAESWFAAELHPEYLGEKFLGLVPGSTKSEKYKRWKNSVGWLAICQQTFRRLYEEQFAKSS